MSSKNLNDRRIPPAYIVGTKGLVTEDLVKNLNNGRQWKRVQMKHQDWSNIPTLWEGHEMKPEFITNGLALLSSFAQVCNLSELLICGDTDYIFQF